jgi:Na+-driven multidrug efflux pump
MSIWYSGMIFLVIPMVGNQAIRATGDTKTAGFIMLVAVLTNCLFDPLLIFGLGPFPRLGIAGAALATLLARCITMVLSLYVLIHREKMVIFSIPPIAELMTSWREILYVGIPTAISGVIAPLAIAVVTRLVAEQGAASVAGFGVASRVEFFFMAIPMSLATVLGPFTAQNQGAKNWQRVEKGIRFCQQVALGFGCFVGILLAFGGAFIGGLFDDHPAVIAVVALHLAIVPAGWGAAGVVAMSNTALNSLHRPLHATGISIIQMFVLLIPLSLIGSNVAGLQGIFSGMALAQLLTSLLAWQIVKRQINLTKRKKNSEAPQIK